MLVHFTVAFLISINLLILIESKQKMLFAFNLFRHGARSPWHAIDSNNIDMYNNKWYGDSELTGIGLRQHYLLGQRDRVRYNDLIGSNFNINDLYVISTNTNRTINSAIAHMQGMFPSGSGEVLNEYQSEIAVPPVAFDFTSLKKELGSNALENKISVIPIHIFQKINREFSLHDSDVCLPIENMIFENINSKVIKDFKIKFESIYGDRWKASEILSKYNFKDEDYYKFYPIFDAAISGYTEGKDMKVLEEAGINPKEFYDFSREYIHMDMFNVYFGDKDNYVGRMSMSPTFSKIINWMDIAIGKDKNEDKYNKVKSPKLVFYSGHDTNIAAMQAFMQAVLDLQQTTPSPFASSFTVELFKDEDTSELSVKIELNDKTLYESTYEDFKEKIKFKLISTEEIANFCKFSSDPIYITTYYLNTGVVIGLCILCFIVILLSIALFITIRRKNAALNFSGSETSLV